ncbi:MAG: hypothetical protein LBU25_08545 [Treponema sp.]|jgi:hypothetical protein|nr:hypothetical protein [Treponema sp.]
MEEVYEVTGVYSIVFLPILISIGCASQPSYSKQKDLMHPLLQTEFKNIIDSASEGSRVGVEQKRGETEGAKSADNETGVPGDTLGGTIVLPITGV